MTMPTCVQAPRTALVVLALLLAGCATSATTARGEDVGTPPSPPPGTPSEALVALADDAVVELDPGTGEVVERHPVDPGGELVALALVPTRDAALVTRRVGDDEAELVEVSLDGTGSRVLRPGAHPAVTPDGSRLAFTRRVGPTDQLELVATSYDGTELAAWPADAAGPETLEMASLSWDPAGEQLAFHLRASTGDEVRVLPVDRSGSLRGASHVVAPTSAGATLTAPAFHRSGVLTVAEGCCEPDAHASWRLLDVTVEAGTTTELAAGLEDPVSHLDWTADGQRLAVTLDGQPPTVSGGVPDDLDPMVEDVHAAEW